MRFKDCFRLSKKHKNYCLVFEKLETNLFELLLQSKDPISQKLKGLNLDFVRMVAWQILIALCLMSVRSVNVIHCDLKPENIMLTQ